MDQGQAQKRHGAGAGIDRCWTPQVKEAYQASLELLALASLLCITRVEKK